MISDVSHIYKQVYIYDIIYDLYMISTYYIIHEVHMCNCDVALLDYTNLGLGTPSIMQAAYTYGHPKRVFFDVSMLLWLTLACLSEQISPSQ